MKETRDAVKRDAKPIVADGDVMLFVLVYMLELHKAKLQLAHRVAA